MLCFQRKRASLGIEAGEESRRAKEKASRALEMEAGVVQREAAVEVKWKEITTARRSLKQVNFGRHRHTLIRSHREAMCTTTVALIHAPIVHGHKSTNRVTGDVSCV